VKLRRIFYEAICKDNQGTCLAVWSTFLRGDKLRNMLSCILRIITAERMKRSTGDKYIAVGCGTPGIGVSRQGAKNFIFVSAINIVWKRSKSSVGNHYRSKFLVFHRGHVVKVVNLLPNNCMRFVKSCKIVH